MDQVTNDNNFGVIFPDHKFDNIEERQIIARLEKILNLVLRTRRRIQPYTFNYVFINILQINEITDVNVIQYMIHNAGLVITNKNMLDIFSPTQIIEYKNNRCKSQMFFSMISSVGLVIVLPVGVIAKIIASFVFAWLLFVLVMGKFFGHDPKYKKYIAASAEAYGEQIFLYLNEKEAYQKLADHHNCEKIARLSAPTIYT